MFRPQQCDGYLTKSIFILFQWLIINKCNYLMFRYLPAGVALGTSYTNKVGGGVMCDIRKKKKISPNKGGSRFKLVLNQFLPLSPEIKLHVLRIASLCDLLYAYICVAVGPLSFVAFYLSVITLINWMCYAIIKYFLRMLCNFGHSQALNVSLKTRSL